MNSFSRWRSYWGKLRPEKRDVGDPALQKTTSVDHIIEQIPDGIRLVEPRLPYMAQFASRELVSDFLNEERSLLSDPDWTKFGFDEHDYEYWAPRLCGVVCLKMITDGYELTNRDTVAGLTTEAVRAGAYSRDSGWRYGPLVRLAETLGLRGEVKTALTLDDIIFELVSNHFVVASVHPGVIRGDYHESPTGRRGGHLIVISGFSVRDGKCEALVVENPSGRVPETQEHAIVSLDRFDNAFAGRGFILWKA